MYIWIVSCKKENLPQFFPLFFTIADEVSIVTRMNVIVDADKESLAVFKGTGKLLHKLPHTLQELVYNRWHLLGVFI